MMVVVETLWGAHALAYALAAAAHAAWGWRSGRAAWWAGAPRAAVAPGSAACAAANLWISYQMEAWAQPRTAWPWADFSVWRVGLQLAAYVFFADVWFYYAHRALHANASLYRHVHAPHHARRHPAALDALNAHPLEHAAANVGSAACGALALRAAGLPQCWAGLQLWIVVATWSTCAAHSGLKTVVPGVLGTSEDHDIHHRKLTVNFGVGLYLLDRLHGTLRTEPE